MNARDENYTLNPGWKATIKIVNPELKKLQVLGELLFLTTLSRQVWVYQRRRANKE